MKKKTMLRNRTVHVNEKSANASPSLPVRVRLCELSTVLYSATRNNAIQEVLFAVDDASHLYSLLSFIFQHACREACCPFYEQK
jgi:hypothetical protein